MYQKKQRIAAMLGIILLVLLYLVTFICAIFNFDGTGRLFQACLFATIAVPILIWVYIWLFGKFTGKHTMADFDLGKHPEPTSNDIVQSDSAKKGTASETITISKRNTKN